MGRPRVIDARKREVICGLVSLGYSKYEAARQAGIARRTMYRTVTEDEEFARQVREAETCREVRPLRQIMEHTVKDWRAGAWLLERMLPDIWARRQPNTVTFGDMMGIFDAMTKLLLEGAPEGDRKRVLRNFDRMFKFLKKDDRRSPRVREAIRVLNSEEEEEAGETGIAGPSIAGEPDASKRSGDAMGEES